MGNPGKRPLNRDEPVFERRMMQVPRHLDDVARAEWRRVVRVLYETGLLTDVDRGALSGYCSSWSTYVRADQELGKVGVSEVVMTNNGNLVRNPWLGVRNEAMVNMLKFMSEFGMTPSSRSRITAAPVEEKSLAAILFEDVDR